MLVSYAANVKFSTVNRPECRRQNAELCPPEVYPRKRKLVLRPRPRDAQRDTTRNQHHTDDGRDPLAMTGLNSEVRTPNLDPLRLGVRNGHDQ